MKNVPPTPLDLLVSTHSGLRLTIVVAGPRVLSQSCGEKTEAPLSFSITPDLCWLLLRARSVIKPGPGFENPNILWDSHGPFENLIRANSARWSFFLVCVAVERITLLLFTYKWRLFPLNDQTMMNSSAVWENSHK